MRFVKKLTRHWLIVLLVIALATAMVALFFDDFASEHKDALMLWSAVLSALSSFLLVVVMIEHANVFKVVNKDEAADNTCGCSKD